MSVDVKINEMKKLNQKLLNLSDSYYNDDESKVSDFEFDEMKRALSRLEEETGVVLPDSILHRVGAPVRKSKKKGAKSFSEVTHEYPAKSLKDITDYHILEAFMVKYNCDMVLSWKEDGLTIQLTYMDGVLSLGATRGDGFVGLDVTENVASLLGVPSRISVPGKVVVRGECVLPTDTFNRINAAYAYHNCRKNYPDFDTYSEDKKKALLKSVKPKYKLERAAASGIIKTDAATVAESRLEFKAFELVYPKANTYLESLESLKKLGFSVVEHTLVSLSKVKATMIAATNEEHYLYQCIKAFDVQRTAYRIPTDGLVGQLNPVNLSVELGYNSKDSLSAFAFKWPDVIKETVLKDVIWTPSKTGTLTPNAVLEGVLLDGSFVEHASLSNITVMQNYGLTYGCTVGVCKAKAIIPHICYAKSKPGGIPIVVPRVCPVCGNSTVVQTSEQCQILKCPNPDCVAKLIKSIEHYVSKEGMSIDGLGGKTVEMLISEGYLRSVLDLYDLVNHSEIQNLDGFGESSYTKMVTAIEKSRICTLDRFIRALGIPSVGQHDSPKLAEICGYDPVVFINSIRNRTDFVSQGVLGKATQEKLYAWFDNSKNANLVIELVKHLKFTAPVITKAVSNGVLSGYKICMSGRPPKEIWAKKEAFFEYASSLGANVVDDWTNDCDMLVCLDSGSTKGVKAAKAGKLVYSYSDFYNMVQSNQIPSKNL